MKELLEIIAIAKGLQEAGEAYAIATVVKIGGSSYRRPGARMLIDADGKSWGTISGGCLEAEVAQQAIAAMNDGSPRLLPFELGDDDVVLGFGTGCDGVVHVFIEPVRQKIGGEEIERMRGEEDGRMRGGEKAGSFGSVLDLFRWSFGSRETRVLATVIEAEGSMTWSLGGHLLVGADGETRGSLTCTSSGDGVRGLGLLGQVEGELQSQLLSKITSASRDLLRVEQSRGQTYLWHTLVIKDGPDGANILLEIVRPPVRLLVFGDGHDVRALVGCAKLMAWEVVVVGRKPVAELKRRFPDADEHVFLMHPEDVTNLIQSDARTAALLMTHTYLRDRELMISLLQTDLPYVGLLGPFQRTDRIFDEIEEGGRTLTGSDRSRLFGPVGLDIGTETPEEIALATVSEIQAVLHRRAGGHLRERRKPIHLDQAAD